MTNGSGRLPPALAGELSRRYDIIDEVGHGGMGEVFLARERMLGRLVAIKVMRAQSTDRDRAEFSGRFLREAQIAARLQHPGIVGLLWFDEVDGTRYFVMPYVDGESLRTRLLRQRRLEEDHAIRIVAEVADALAYAHAQGVVHRDIKPENILLTANSERAMVADFGIAKSAAATPLTSTGSLLGTPAYMSPDQWAGEKDIDGRSDVYSLGIIAYELVAGAPPFEGSWDELMRQHCQMPPTPLIERAPGVSTRYAAAVMRCLAKEPSARWRSATEFASELRAIKDEDPDPPELRPIRHVLAYGVIGALAMATWGAAVISSNVSPDWMSYTALVALWLLGAAVPLAAATVFTRRHVRRIVGPTLECARERGRTGEPTR
jgi:serine/threonine protein kinase